jgi:F0F1-type ATP synthase delta subunit
MEERSQIRTSLAQAVKIDPSKLIIQFNVDKEILGGIIARVDDDIYDASIRSRLQDIRSSLL